MYRFSDGDGSLNMRPRENFLGEDVFIGRIYVIY